MKKNFTSTATLYLAQHDDLVKREPLQVENLLKSLLKAKMLDDVKFVLEIILDKKDLMMLTCKELKRCFQLCVAGYVKIEPSRVEQLHWYLDV